MSILPNGFSIIDQDGLEYTILKYDRDYYEVFRIETQPGKLPRYITKYFSSIYVDNLLHEK